MNGLSLTFLGTGTSVGVPMVGCECEVCRSEDPRDQRLRCSVLIETPEARWLVDAGPDLRQQCLRERIGELDAVIFTHPHADHIVGFDDLRRFTAGRDASLPVYAQASCLRVLEHMFFYIFNGENRYPGYFKPAPQVIDGSFELGVTEVVPVPVEHGKVECVGYLFRRAGRSLLAYIPDCKRIPEAGMAVLEGVECLVIDALRDDPHPTHMCIDESVAVARELGAGQTWLTHIAHQVLHARDEPSLPRGVRIAYDGLRLEL